MQQGVRLPWAAIPDHVCQRIGVALGSPVLRAATVPGGFTPGFAGCCDLADGRRYFVKAVSGAQNPDTPEMHRREAWINARMPRDLPVPEFIEIVDTGEWIALVFESIEGQAPGLPWSLTDLATTFAALDVIAERATPSPISELASFADRHLEPFSGYHRAAEGDHALLDEWSRRHLDRLVALESQWPAATAGETLLHSDVRADNLLLTSEGKVILVDWPHACVGAAWVDKVWLLPSVGLDGGPSPTEVEHALRPFSTVDADAVNSVVTALAGYFTYRGAQVDPVGIPHLRAFQRAQGRVARKWLAERLRIDPPRDS